MLQNEAVKRPFEPDETVRRALEFAAQVTDRIYSQHPELRRQEASIRTMAANLSIFHRVYIGSVHFEVPESDLSLIFSQFGPIKSIQMITDPNVIVSRGRPQHKGYGFVEFEMAEAAELACRADGLEVAHRPVKVGRPANFPQDLPPGIPRPPANRVYIGNVARSIGEAELNELLGIVGSIKTVRLSPDSSTSGTVHRGYGYAEFERSADAVSACTLLNGFEIAGRRLAVIKAIVGGPLIEGMESAKMESGKATVVVCKNMVDRHEVEDEEQRADLMTDVLSECRKFGDIVDSQLIINLNGNVNIYLHYDSDSSASNALNALNGRWFGGRQLVAQEYNLDRYLMRDFE